MPRLEKNAVVDEGDDMRQAIIYLVGDLTSLASNQIDIERRIEERHNQLVQRLDAIEYKIMAKLAQIEHTQQANAEMLQAIRTAILRSSNV